MHHKGFPFQPPACSECRGNGFIDLGVAVPMPGCEDCGGTGYKTYPILGFLAALVCFVTTVGPIIWFFTRH